MTIDRSIDIEDTVRQALAAHGFAAYCRPLPEEYTLPCLLITQVGGTDDARIDTFEVTLDARADSELAATLTLRNAVAVLRAAAKTQETALRYVSVNSSGSWGSDPVRPDLAMCTARLRITAHQEKTEV